MFKVLDLNTTQGREEYKTYVSEYKIHSAYSTLEYFEVFCGGFQHLICFVFEQENQGILMPGYLKKIQIYEQEKDFFDFSTPYGYSGPFYTSNTNDTLVKDFWKKVDEWYKENKVVSEFIRFNLFGNSSKYNGQLHDTMLNIKGEIVDEETQWKRFDAKVRKNVKRAQKENLSVNIYFKNIDPEHIKTFYTIYIDTMKRTQATQFFFYSYEQFEKFILINKELCAICTVSDKNVAVSTELLLLSNDSVFSFLGGTLEEAFDKRPNDFLKFSVINWARNQQIKYYVLGGGYGYEDGIYKYKKAFFPNDIVIFTTGRKIVDEQTYTQFVDEVCVHKNENEKEEMNHSTYFPLYNKQ